MRLAILFLLLGARTAAAEDVPSPHPMPPVGFTVGIIGHGGKLAGLDEGGWGPNAEVAVGSGRWQGFGEAGFARVKLGPEDDRISGWQLRGGLGVRWLARSFELSEHGSLDMHLEAFAGYSRFAFDGMARIARPDLGVGVGYAVRGFFGRRPRQAGLRISARIFFAPIDKRDAEIACRGTCPMIHGNTNSGLMAVFGGAF